MKILSNSFLITLTLFVSIYRSYGQENNCFSLNVGSCTVLNQSIKGASLELIGTKKQILDFLDIKEDKIRFHVSCRFLFGPPGNEEFKPKTCISQNLTLHFVNSPEEMLKLYRALIPPRIPPGKDLYKLNSGKNGGTPSGLPCHPETELCISSSGEMSVTICCNDFCFGLSSEGEYTISAGKGAAKVSFSFP